MQLVKQLQSDYIICYTINRMAKGTRKVKKRTSTIASRKVRHNPFSTRNLRAALMNIHRNVEAASRIIDKKINNVPARTVRASKARFLQSLKANRNIKEQIKQKRQQLKHNIDDITMMMSKL